MDQTDNKILEILQINGRISMQKLAQEINMSAPATIERVKRLEQNGAIIGYRTLVRPDRMGRDVLAYVLITVDRRCLGMLYQLIQKSDAIVNASELAGHFTHFIELSCRDMDEFQRMIYQLSELGTLETNIVMDHLKKGIYKNAEKAEETEEEPHIRGEHSPFRERYNMAYEPLEKKLDFSNKKC